MKRQLKNSFIALSQPIIAIYRYESRGTFKTYPCSVQKNIFSLIYLNCLLYYQIPDMSNRIPEIRSGKIRPTDVSMTTVGTARISTSHFMQHLSSWCNVLHVAVIYVITQSVRISKNEYWSWRGAAVV